MVLGPTAPQDADELRLEARRQRERERTQKLGPGRLRNIGADIAGVRNQVAEHEQQAAAAREAQREQDEEDAAIRRYLLQVESEDALARRRELRTLRLDWDAQAAEAQATRARDAAVRALGVDPDACAPGAAQHFAGEDAGAMARRRLQALQLKQWTLAQMASEAQRDAESRDAQQADAKQLLDVERRVEELHEANERERAANATDVRRFNERLRETQREQEDARRRLEQQQDAREIALTLQSDLVSENPQQAALPGVALERRVRVDHWKGLSKAQTRLAVASNDALLADKARARRQQHAQDAQHAQEQRELQRAMARDEHEAQRRRAQTEREVRATREQQAQQAAEREKANAERARGKIEPGFFQAFGRSYR